MEERFWAAVDVIKSIPYDGTFEPSEELLLKLHAFEQQATFGPCCIPKPYVWNISSRAKWAAWNSLEDMSKEEAMSNYIEELTKVIETMSYNEKISRFMSLIGPFYEVVTSDEIDKDDNSSCPSSALENYIPPTISELYRMSKSIDHEDFQKPKGRKDLPQDHHFAKDLLDSFSSSSSSEMSEFDLLSDLTDADSSSDEWDSQIVVAKGEQQKFPSENDVLGLAFINLQTSMEEILKKFNNLHSLVETDIQHLEASNDRWGLNLPTTAFAFLWPVACTAMLEGF